ncbi:MAG: 1-acyl-sn-glycerol-3-phosphate acyltransferase [Acidimicrobiales bacterium]
MLISALCRFLTHLFFSRVGVLHAERIPTSGPVIIVANHHSALVDPMVLLATLERQPRFMAKAVLWDWKYLPLRPILRLARAVPVHRVKDGGGDNSAMFAATREVLLDGGMVAVFGEGVSHDMPGLKDLKTGPARIALGTPTETSVIPVGLVFPDRPRYRSTVTVVVGDPLVVSGSEGGDADRNAVHIVTRDLTAALGKVAPTWEYQDDQHAAHTAASVVAARHDVTEGEVLNRINRALDAENPIATDVLNASKDLLDECQLLDVELKHVLDENAGLGALARSARFRAVLWVLPTILGHIVNYPAYLTVDLIARRNDYNFQATSKLLAGALVYPAWWLMLFVGTWWGVSLGWAVVVALSAIVGGYIAGAKMRLVKSFNAHMSAEENHTDLSSLERLFDDVLRAVDQLPR